MYREWAPGAAGAALIGDFNNWSPDRRDAARNALPSVRWVR
jgi:hypothetical protein